MKIAVVASEAAPFVKTGGLGDVMQALPLALSKQKNTYVSLFLPYYSQIKYSEKWPVETAPAGYSADTGHGERRRNGTAHKIAEKYRWVDAQHRTAERFRPAQRLKRHCIS